ncbi:APA family basic amino acid/polyamine antiporter [Trichodelitschia bisporula]|uniref:APA family basic amino acid/polyamine antiporter n=1 Tax=Trichodelitschia bisporula TaxID=703511 RepID=A0A6G1I9S9_9PEZI|nr:APA family basic amino acid/polyamine antiporter [Trichodelitschia bisporula]
MATTADEPVLHETANQIEARDEAKLAELGYKQELQRDWSVLHNFGVSFSIISVVTGITTLFSYGLATGGPGVMASGWLIVSFMTLFVGLSMAEIVSAIPTSGGPYFWAAILAPPQHAPFFSWLTGFLNLLGQVAVTTGITFGCAGLISTLATVKSPDYTPTAGRTLGIYAALLVSHGLVNTFGVHILRYLNNTSIVLHSLGVGSLAIAVVAAAPTHQSAKAVFGTFYDGTGDPGWGVRASPAYVAICGILLSQYTITGFDASAHMSEETRSAARSAPIGVMTSIGVSAIFGFFYLLCLLFSVQDWDRVRNSDYGQPVLQIFVDAFGVNGAVVAMTLVIICVWHCGLFSLTSNSRMMFAFSRDGALPRYFNSVDKRFRSPIRTIWLAASLAFLLALPSLGNSVAFAAATSIATIGLYLSYALPVLISIIWHKHFVRGPFNLGRFSRPVGIVTCTWVTFISIVFCLPTVNPVNKDTLNYTPVAVGIVLVGTLGSWFLWARKWFTGPRRQIELAAIGVDVNDPAAVVEAEEAGVLDGKGKVGEKEVSS